MIHNPLILAGKRDSDPLKKAYALANKALLPVGGKLAIMHVISALQEAGLVGKVSVSLRAEDLSSFQTKLACDLEYLLVSPSSSPAQAVLQHAQANPSPFLVVSCDAVLLRAKNIQDFLGQVKLNPRSELYLGVANMRYAPSEIRDKRTLHKLNSELWITGANLFYWAASLESSQAFLGCTDQFDRIRKYPLLIALYLALRRPLFLLKLLWGNVSLLETEEIISLALGLKTSLIVLEDYESGIDVDKQADLDLALRVLASRELR